MSTGSATAIFTCHRLRPDRGTVFLGRLKRVLVPLLRRLVRHGEVSYPSPPMSDPSTPTRIPSHGSIPPISEQHPVAAASTPSSSHMPGLTIAAPTQESRIYDSIPPQTEIDRPPIGHASLMQPVQPPTQSERGETSTHDLESPQTAARPPSSRGGRKAKAHVASACINCKRAHLSCDVSRPCARCVAAGKQDTCVDVQHKKRGRPRLREEGEFKVEQMQPEAGPSIATPTATADHSVRPIAATRPRRAESFRSLRSQGSEGSGAVVSPTYPLPPPATAPQPTFGFQGPPAPNTSSRGYEVPTAYMDLDLVIIKANSPFCQIMLGGREAARHQLNDIAAPVDGESFQTIRNRLRAEREAREPVYMPPIILPGHDPLLGALEADVDQYTRGFDDHTFTWTQTQIGPSGQTFPARVRLAKASSYFVTVTLPSFRPVEPSSQPAPPLYPRRPDTYSAPRSMPSEPSPRAGFVPYSGTLLPAPRPASRTSQAIQHTALRTFQPSHPSAPLLQPSPQQGYSPYQSTPSTTPRLHVAEPPTETTAFTPRTTSRELPQSAPVGPSVQLPPILGSGTPGRRLSAAVGPSGVRNVEVTTARQGESSNDEDGDPGSSQRSPRKRRKMDIDQVLHR